MQLTVLLHILLALVLGGVIGLEREWAAKPAGLRTHMLVAGAAAMLVGMAGAIVRGPDVGESLVRSDPIRIVEALVTGITFLGAGTIIRQEEEVEGLTTAASLLVVATIGIAVALELYGLAIGVTVLLFVVLRGVKWIEDRFIAGRAR